MSTEQIPARPGTISGKVSLPNGEPLPGVLITTVSTTHGSPHTLVSDAGGRFRFPGLQPGQYQLRAQLTGFTSYNNNDVQVSSGESTVIDFELQPARASR